MAKSLIRLRASLKSLSTSPKYFGVVRLCHSQSESTELTTLTQKSPSEAKKLFDLFTNDINPISLIINIEANKHRIDGRHVVTAFTSLYKFYEQNPVPNVQNSPQFTKLVDHLNKHVRNLEMPQILQALKILSLFQVKSSSTVVQNLLQLIRVSINELHPHEIYYLSFLLKQMKPTYLGNAIYTALPEVFEARIKTKLDVEDLTELSNALKFATNYVQAKNTIEFLVYCIHKYNGPIDASSAFQIFQSLCKNENLADDDYDIFLRLKDVITKNVDKYSEIEIMIIISKTSAKILQGHVDFYDPIFLDLLINQIIKNNFGPSKGLKVLGQINQYDHVHLPLLRYIANKCYNNPEILTVNPKNMIKLTQGLANTDYKPPCWENLKLVISNNYKKLEDHVTMAYLALYMVTLDDCNFDMIRRIFTLDQNADQLSPDYRETLCELYQVVKTVYPMYKGPWPLDEIVDSFKTLQFKYKPTHYPLTPALNKLLGDPAYIKTNVCTNLGHYIDHLVVLQDGFPIAIESNVTSEDPNATCYVEDMNIPQDCEKVAICLLPAEACGRNIPLPKAKIRVMKKSLEAMSFKVVLIPQNTWLSMPDNETLPYLQHMIGVKAARKNKSSEVGLDKLMEASR